MPEERREAAPQAAPQEIQKPPESPEAVAARETASVTESPPVDSPAAAAAVVAALPAPPPPVQPLDPYAMRIERALEDGLADVYMAMPPAARARFKQVGEETVAKIRALIEEAKVQLDVVVRLIRDWLRIIPSVNKYYLEQEAKIKTDKMTLIAEELRRERGAA